MTDTIRVGTSGWSYPTGEGTWNGIFYPRKTRGRGKGAFDELAFYADHFDTVEVNSSFYRVPARTAVQSWASRTPRDFDFSVKLYQKFTHPQMFRAATGAADDSVTQADVDAFRSALEPMAASGKLGALLAQFPPSFKSSPESLDYLHWLVRAFDQYPLAVELRHRSWSDGLRETLTLLNDAGAAWVQIDEPKFHYSIRQNFLPNVKSFYYMRLHGRNAAQWWKHDKSEDRYNYLYSAEELQPVVDTADAARRLVRKMYVYLNNHFSAKAVANAVMLKKALNLSVDGDYPPEFAARYPDVAGIVRTAPSLLSPTPS
jgi:uncharacterized protein YecE (DUF72 family)